MKNFSLILNIILLLAVAILYKKIFTDTPSQKVVASNNINTKTGTNSTTGSIAYVELDSLNEKISYIKDRRKELEAEQKAIETEWQNGYRILESRKNEFLKKGSSITQQEAEKFQGELMQQQQKVDANKQNSSRNLSEKSYKLMDDIQKKLKDFLNNYNQNKKYQYILTTGTGLDYMLYKDSTFNITADVIKGMNDKMKEKK